MCRYTYTRHSTFASCFLALWSMCILPRDTVSAFNPCNEVFNRTRQQKLTCGKIIFYPTRTLPSFILCSPIPQAVHYTHI